jgi:5'(3')-deoxyribonucleotidase
MKKVKISINLDDVLCRFLPVFNKYYNSTLNVDARKIKLEDYKHGLTFSEVWGIPEKEVHDILNFFRAEGHYENLKVIENAKECLEELIKTNKCEFHLVTSRSNEIKNVTMEWINKNFRDIFSSIHFVHSDEEKCDVYKKINSKITVYNALLGITKQSKNTFLENNIYCLILDTENYYQEKCFGNRALVIKSWEDLKELLLATL